jgi:hypothetical protein
MTSHTTHDRLRAQAEGMTDPLDRRLLERLADLQELDERRRTLPAGSPERGELEDRIADGANRILHHDPDVEAAGGTDED